MPVHKKLTGTEQILNHESDKGAQSWRNGVKSYEERSGKEYAAIVTWRYSSTQEHFSLFSKAG